MSRCCFRVRLCWFIIMKRCAALFSGAGLVVVSVQLEGAEGHQAACVGLQARGCFVSSKTFGVVVGDMRGLPLVRRWSLWNAYHCDACSCNNCCFKLPSWQFFRVGPPGWCVGSAVLAVLAS